MKILFSEINPDYSKYLYPYVVWGIPEPGEKPGQFFDAGFMPGAPDLSRFYLCRQIRVPLGAFELSSENRRILRKGSNISCRLVPRPEFDYSEQRRKFFKSYADKKWGADIMTWERLDGLFRNQVISHVLLFQDDNTGAELGAAVLYLESPAMAFYYYAFYDLDYVERSLGMFMMTSAVKFFSEQGFAFIYLGTCYSEKALYKTQFDGMEFFNGFRWSRNLEELKFLVRRDPAKKHLLDDEQFRAAFYEGALAKIVAAGGWRIDLATLPS